MEHHAHSQSPHGSAADGQPTHDEAVHDPMCGMSVSPATATATEHHDRGGRTWHFRSARCAEVLPEQKADVVKRLQSEGRLGCSIPSRACCSARCWPRRS